MNTSPIWLAKLVMNNSGDRVGRIESNSISLFGVVFEWECKSLGVQVEGHFVRVIFQISLETGNFNCFISHIPKRFLKIKRIARW